MIKRILKRIDVPFGNGCNMKIKTLEKSRVFRAGDGNRTHVSSLEGWCSTIELHPRNALDRNRTSDTRIFSPLLYQLSYLGPQLNPTCNLVS